MGVNLLNVILKYNLHPSIFLSHTKLSGSFSKKCLIPKASKKPTLADCLLKST